jgi:hypothetical protein
MARVIAIFVPAAAFQVSSGKVQAPIHSLLSAVVVKPARRSRPSGGAPCMSRSYSLFLGCLQVRLSEREWAAQLRGLR